MALPGERPARAADRAALQKAIEDLLLACGAELDAETRATPERVAKAYAEDFLDGYARDPVEALKSSLVPAPRKGELVIVSQLDFHAMCPHHLLPYKGTAAVGYVADKWLVGFGKIAEAVVSVYGETRPSSHNAHHRKSWLSSPDRTGELEILEMAGI